MTIDPSAYHNVPAGRHHSLGSTLGHPAGSLGMGTPAVTCSPWLPYVMGLRLAAGLACSHHLLLLPASRRPVPPHTHSAPDPLNAGMDEGLPEDGEVDSDARECGLK